MGLLISEHSTHNLLEPEQLVGKQSAVKSIEESAFGREDSELESLEYNNY